MNDLESATTIRPRTEPFAVQVVKCFGKLFQADSRGRGDCNDVSRTTPSAQPSFPLPEGGQCACPAEASARRRKGKRRLAKQNPDSPAETHTFITCIVFRGCRGKRDRRLPDPAELKTP